MSNTKFSLLPSYENYPETFKPEGIEERTYIRRGTEVEMADKETGDIRLFQEIDQSRRTLHDSWIYTKLFRNKNIEIRDLSVPGFNLFYYVASSLKPLQKDICINENDFLSQFGYKPGSRRLYYQAVTELIGKKVLARKAGMNRCFWINSNVLFNGDRTKL
jgi:hypothetical protein